MNATALRLLMAVLVTVTSFPSSGLAFEWSGKRIEIAKGLDSPAPRDRISALRALALFPPTTEVLQLVRGALADSSSSVQMTAIDVLAELGAEKEETSLHPFLSVSDAELRAAAVRTLGRIGTAKSVDPLVRTLGDPSPAVRKASIESLVQIDPDRARVPVASLLDDTEEEVVLAAVDALARVGGPTAVFPLLEKVKAPSLKTQVAAVTGLGRLGDRRAALPLAALLDDGHPEVRAAAVIALGELRDPAATPHLVAVLWRNQHGALASPILRSLGQIGDPRAVPALLQMLRFSKHRRLAQRALEDTGAPAVQPLLHAMQRDMDGGFRQACLQVLQVLLEEGLPEREQAIINRVLLELWEKGNTSPELLTGGLIAGGDPTSAILLANHVQSLAGQETDEASRVRRRILEGLSRWRGGFPAGPILTAWPDLPKTERLLAIRALGATESPRAVRLLSHELGRGDEQTQLEAARALAKIPTPAAAKALLGALDDASESLQHEIGIGLGAQREPSARRALLARLPRTRGSVRQSVLMALGDHYRDAPDGELREAVWKVALNDADARSRTLDVLGAKPDRDLADRAAALYDDAPTPLKRKIVQVLGDAAAQPEILLEASQSRQPGLRAEAAWALREVEAAGATTRLSTLAADPAPMVSINASAALAHHVRKGVDTDLLRAALSSAAPPAKANLLLALERLAPGNMAQAQLATLARRESDPLVAEAVARILIQRGTDADMAAARRLHKRLQAGGHRLAVGRLLGLRPPGPPGEGWVRFLFTDGPSRLAGQRVLVILPNGIVVAKESDEAGEVRLENLPQGECRLRFLDDSFTAQ